MKKILFLLSLLILGCTPSKTDVLKGVYNTAKKEKDIVKLENALNRLNALEPDTWQVEYTNIVRAAKNLQLAKEALNAGNLHDALNYAKTSSHAFYSKQAGHIVSEVNKKAINLNAVYTALNTLESQKESVNQRVEAFYKQDVKSWNIIEFNSFLVDLIDKRRVFAKLKPKLESDVNKSDIFIEANKITTNQLMALDNLINRLLSKIVIPVSSTLISFSDSVSEQTILNLNHFPDENVPSMMASYYKKFNADNQQYTDLVENIHLVTFQNNYKGFIDMFEFYTLYNVLSNPPKSYKNYENIISQKHSELLNKAEKAKSYKHLTTNLNVYEAPLLWAFHNDLQQFMNE